MVRSNRSHSFSVRKRVQWSIRNCKPFFNSRFSNQNKFNWFRRFSKCLCLCIRDRRADSRFDIILLFFLSSIFWFELSEAGFSFGSPEPELEVSLGPVGRKVGLPLSIVVLAGLLANKEKSHREWFKVLGLWITEGFIQETGSRDARDVAEDYLYKLIDRSLIQVAQVKVSGSVKTCRIHDLLKDLCILESKEDKFFQVCIDNNILISTKPRKLSFHSSMSHYVSLNTDDHSCVPSVFCSDPTCLISPDEWKWLTKNFKLVWVLDLEGKYCFKIPSNLGIFIHLRYLRINSEDIISVPNYICNLQNLETLDLGSSWNDTIYFPMGILKLKHLRHMYNVGFMMLRGRCFESNGDVPKMLLSLQQLKA